MQAQVFGKNQRLSVNNNHWFSNSYTPTLPRKQHERKIISSSTSKIISLVFPQIPKKPLHQVSLKGPSSKTSTNISSAIMRCLCIFSLLLNLGFFSSGLLPTAFLSTAQAAAPTTPLMGVDASTIYGCTIDHDKVISLAKSLADSRLLVAGYNLIEINDCWQKRDAQGKITADTDKFPLGMSALSAELHDMGIKLGLSLDLSKQSCAQSIGSAGHIPADTNALASWGIDELSISACDSQVQQKLKDNCSTSKGSLFLNPLFEQVLNTLVHAKKSLWVTSLIPANVAAVCGDQNTAYIQAMDFATHHVASWISLAPPTHNWDRFLDTYSNAIANLSYQHPGSFGAAAYLNIGQGFLNNDEEKSQLGLWAICAAPLILASDPAHLSDAEKTMLTNSDIIRLDQTSLRYGPAYQLITNDSIDLLMRQTSPQSYMAVEFAKGGFFNFGSDVPIPWELPGSDWIQTDIATGNSTPLPTSLSGMGLGHHIVIYRITHGK